MKFLNIFCSEDIDWTAVSAIANCIYTAIAVVGTLYIIKSFRQQARINDNQLHINQHQIKLFEQQKELNSIALQNHIRNIKPFFAIDTDNNNELDFSLKNAIARSVNVWIFDKDEKITSHLVKGKTATPDTYSFQVSKRHANPIRGSKKIFVLIKYIDEDGRYYYQKVYNDTNFGITWPKLLLEDKSLDEILIDSNR
jgi:hypothetical protein